jgi:uncharacterized protein (DUF2062 family)
MERLRRLIRYRLIIPVFRSPHPPEYTARGVANGVLWGMTPFMGLQTLAMLGTWAGLRHVFRKESSLVQALIWAWVNNPITMIPMYYVFFVTGAWLTGSSSRIGGYDAFVAVWDASQIEPTWFARGIRLTRDVGLAVSIGCLPYAVVCSWISYQWALRVVCARRRRIAKRTAR